MKHLLPYLAFATLVRVSIMGWWRPDSALIGLMGDLNRLCRPRAGGVVPPVAWWRRALAASKRSPAGLSGSGLPPCLSK